MVLFPLPGAMINMLQTFKTIMKMFVARSPTISGSPTPGFLVMFRGLHLSRNNDAFTIWKQKYRNMETKCFFLTHFNYLLVQNSVRYPVTLKKSSS